MNGPPGFAGEDDERSRNDIPIFRVRDDPGQRGGARLGSASACRCFGAGHLPIRNALLVGIEDGAECQMDGAGGPRFVPIARAGWTGWAPAGSRFGKEWGFGRALLVEVRALPHPEGVTRFSAPGAAEADGICVYEEVIGPGQAA